MTHSRLESLPPELQVLIMKALPDVEALRLLVRASPISHAVYRSSDRQRTLIFQSLAITQIHPRVGVDFWYTYQSMEFMAYAMNNDKNVAELVSRYLSDRVSRQFIENGSMSRGIHSLSLDDCVALNQLHRNVLWEVDDYLNWLSRQPNGMKYNRGSLTEKEFIRLYRAVCRLQTYCNLFTFGYGGNASYSHSQFPSDQWYLPGFMIWEIQEMASIFHYLFTRWETMVKDISLRLLEQNRKDGDPTIETVTSVFHKRSPPYLKLLSMLSNEGPVDRPCLDTTSRKLDRLHGSIVHAGPVALPRFLRQDLLFGFRILPGYYLSGREQVDCFQHTYAGLRTSDRKFRSVGLGIVHRPRETSILLGLDRMPDDERPSMGWMWFLDRCMPNFRTHAISLNWLWLQPPPAEVFKPESIEELRWGYPFWDLKKLEASGRLNDDLRSRWGLMEDPESNSVPDV